MAATQRFEKVLNNGYSLELYISQQSQDTTGNRSQARWELRLTRYGTLKAYSGFQNPWTVVVDGERFSGSSSYNYNNYQMLTLGSGTKWITHGTDGKKTISVTASFTDVASDNNVGDTTEAGFVNRSYTFDDIARSSQPRLSSATRDAGTSVTIYTDRASTSFTHTVRYTMGDASGTIASGVTDSVAWTIPESLLNEFPNAATGYGHIHLETFSGGVSIGTKAVQIAVTAPASAGPSFTAASFSEANSVIAAMALGGGRYVQGESRLNFTFTGAAAKYSATIAKYSVLVGTTTLGEHTAASGGVTTTGIPTSGTITLTATVTDSRGLKASKTYTATSLAYAAPTISTFSVTRSNSVGSIMEDGDYARVVFSASVSSITTSGGVQKNTIQYKIESRQKGTTTWTTKVNSTAVTGPSVSPSPLNYGTYATAQSHEFQLTITDKLAKQTIKISSIPIATIFMHWNASLGMGLGKFHNPANGMLDVLGFISQNNGKRVLDTDTVKQIDADIVAVPSVPSGGSINVTVTFNLTFTAAPVIAATTTVDRHEVVVSSVTTTGCVLRFTNRTAAAAAGNCHWIAVLK